MYVKDIAEITDSTEIFLCKISALEEDNRQLKDENAKLKLENLKKADTIETLEEKIMQLRIENAKLKHKAVN